MTQMNNNSDIGITCGKCSSLFTGKSDYSRELLDMFNSHPCNYLKIKTEYYPLPKDFDKLNKLVKGENNE